MMRPASESIRRRPRQSIPIFIDFPPNHSVKPGSWNTIEAFDAISSSECT